ncbi:PAS domain-containing protein [Litoreibacter roseus]|uniref:Diguanylate cyclase n=1 Tax=Litoreibacter roseus TaxID=2601869 RepID=A0A6N6JEX0_9RHOB|nr:PAS domain-containing protein [Litoreibacter roseus]GFE64776.1 diguanylate cyclase [Litoreibacter roseus]
MSIALLPMALVLLGGFGIGGLVLWLFSQAVPPTARQVQYSEPHVFTFENRELVATSPAAKQALSVEDLDEDIFHQLISRLSTLFPALQDRLDNAEQLKIPFTLHDLTSGGPISVAVTFDDRLLSVAVTGIAAPLSRKILVDHDRAKAANAELQVLRGTVETSPVAMWREDAGGNIDWVNKAYRDLVEDSEEGKNAAKWPIPRLFDSSPVACPGEQAVPKRSKLTKLSGDTDWFEIASYGRDESSLHYAFDANATVKAENSLRSYMQTLTQTFAYLPTGLAIFDKSRQLVLFNPALMELTSLRPEWLSARPTLYDFLNQLRESRMIPERKDFCDWRKKIAQLEQSAQDGTYGETWTLPNGQIYRVTGRPHPEGAIAFLIENITAEMSLTRKFRQELELSQSLFDSIPEAIAIFGPEGVVTMANAAYTALWGSDPMSEVAQISVVDAIKQWQEKTMPSPIWGDLRDFSVQMSERVEWSGMVTLNDGRAMICRVAPLPGNTTLVGFTEADAQVRETIVPMAVVPPNRARMSG